MYRPRRPPPPHPPNPLDDGPLGPVFMALRAAGADPGDEIRAAEALGVTAPDLARLVRLHAEWKARGNPTPAVRAHWAIALLERPDPVLHHLLSPREAWCLGLECPNWQPRLGGIHPLPEFLAAGRTGPGAFALGPGPALDLSWCRGVAVDLEVTGPVGDFRLPVDLQGRGWLRLRNLHLPRTLAPKGFEEEPADLVLEDCTGLRRLSRCTGVRTVVLRRCPDLERVDLATHDLTDLWIEDCPRLSLVRFGRGTSGPVSGPAVTLVRCPGLTRAGFNPGLRREFFLRSLRVEDCPAFEGPSAFHRLPRIRLED